MQSNSNKRVVVIGQWSLDGVAAKMLQSEIMYFLCWSNLQPLCVCYFFYDDKAMGTQITLKSTG